MAAMMKVWFLLMLPINTNLLLVQEPQYIVGTKGVRVMLQVMCQELADEIFFYRSDQQRPPFSDNPSFGRTTYYINHRTLAVQISENQEYLAECWNGRKLLDKKHFHLIACTEKDAEEKMTLHHGVPADIACQKFNPSNGETLQVIQTLQASQYIWTSSTILDTNVSMEILPDVLKSKTQVLNNGSLIHFSHVSAIDSGVYSCLVWSDNQCQNYKEISMHVEQYIFLDPEQSFTLPCQAKDLEPGSSLVWFSKNAIYIRGRIMSDQSEMLNDEQTGNYSLVIPRLSLNHTGTYTCSTTMKNYNVLTIFVCADLKPINMTFSLNGTANLTCHPNLAGAFRVQWYWEYNQSSKYLLTDTQTGFINEKMKDRVNVLKPQSYITISKLLIGHGGLYWCRVWKTSDDSGGLCFKRRIYLTYVAQYGDTVYTVYASLMITMLFGMVVVVVCVTVLKRRQQPPKKTECGQLRFTKASMT